MRNKRAGKAVAALAMGIVVAAGLVAVGAKESGPSLTYHELLVLAGDKTQAASAEQDLEAASGLPEAIGEEAVAVSKLKEELEEIDAENGASSEAVPEEMPESEAAASEESASAESTAPEASSASVALTALTKLSTRLPCHPVRRNPMPCPKPPVPRPVQRPAVPPLQRNSVTGRLRSISARSSSCRPAVKSGFTVLCCRPIASICLTRWRSGTL